MASNFLTLGDNYKVPLALFRDNRDKLRQQLKGGDDDYVVVLRGGPSETRFDSDHELLFRQESYFWYLTGVKEPDCCLVLTPTKILLGIPELPPDYATVMGKIPTPQDMQDTYHVDQVFYTHQLETVVREESMNGSSSKILVLKGTNSDSGNEYDLAPQFQDASLQNLVDTTTLFPILAECRVTKSAAELALMEHVTQITSFAHAYVMRNMKPHMWEFQAESLFRHYTYYNYGSRLQAYTSICGCGPKAAVLHYGHAGEPNSKQILPSACCLFDMGAEYMGYASDVTCSFPASGRFDLCCNGYYAQIYQAVLKAQIAVYDMLEPGVSWVDCHKRAEATILKALAELGVIHLWDKTVDELVEMRLGAVFMPHGLGHLIGIDCHDVGGYLPGHPPRSDQPGLAKLRMGRILQADMVLTVEPGCYFIDHLLDQAISCPNLSPHIRVDKLHPYRGMGGVRLEDVVWIPHEGPCVNFTLCPRTIPEVEHVMACGKWPPTVDEAPELRRVKLTSPISPLGPPSSR